jgi:hypothetical protein
MPRDVSQLGCFGKTFASWVSSEVSPPPPLVSTASALRASVALVGGQVFHRPNDHGDLLLAGLLAQPFE